MNEQVEVPMQLVISSLQQQIANQALQIAMLEARLASIQPLDASMNGGGHAVEPTGPGRGTD